MNSVRMLIRRLRPGAMAAVLGCGIAAAMAQTVPVAVNLPLVEALPVAAGSTSLDVVFPVSGADSMRIEVIAPLAGVTLRVLDPNGAEVFSAGDPDVAFLDGTQLVPPLPGGIFLTPDIPTPGDGDWVARLAFPAATDPATVLGTLFISSDYQAGLALTSDKYILGQTESIGLLVLNNGTPILGLSPTMTVRPPSGATTTLFGKDDGTEASADGAAADGIYSAPYTYAEVGRHRIDGEAVIPRTGGAVTRTAQAYVDVFPPIVTLQGVQTSTLTGPGGCVEALQLDVDLSLAEPATVTARALLLANSGDSLLASQTQSGLLAGDTTVSLTFPSGQIQAAMSVDGPYDVDPLEILSLTANGVLLETREPAVATFPAYALADFCVAPIIVEQGLAVTPTLRDGMIDTLSFSIPVRVQSAGNYQVSGQIVSAGNRNLYTFGTNVSLNAGPNQIGFSVPHERFQDADGPYRVESVLVLGAGASARASIVGESQAYSRWQFYPVVRADYTGDGVVDRADLEAMRAFRGQSALVPGDRRDLDRDGRITNRDIGYVLREWRLRR
jgi:hypothetical protein